jgi:hypothetical protein
MKESLQHELRYLFRVWIICVLLPLPLVLFRHLPAGRSYALMSYSFNCAILVAYSYRRDIRPQRNSTTSETWRDRIFPLSLALFAMFLVFSTVCLAISGTRDLAAPMLAFLVLIPALGIVPCMVLVTRNPLAGALFSILLVGSLKTPIGAMMVHTFFPSHFQQDVDTDGALIMPTPWIHPNLLVWFFYCSVAVLSFLFYFWGIRKFRALHALPA